MSCGRYNNTGTNTFVFTDSGYIQTSTKPADSRIYLTLSQLSHIIYNFHLICHNILQYAVLFLSLNSCSANILLLCYEVFIYNGNFPNYEYTARLLVEFFAPSKRVQNFLYTLSTFSAFIYPQIPHPYFKTNKTYVSNMIFFGKSLFLFFRHLYTNPILNNIPLIESMTFVNILSFQTLTQHHLRIAVDKYKVLQTSTLH